MDPVAAVAQSSEAIAQVLQMAVQSTTETAEKMMKASVEMSLSINPGIGQAIDMIA